MKSKAERDRDNETNDSPQKAKKRKYSKVWLHSKNNGRLGKTGVLAVSLK